MANPNLGQAGLSRREIPLANGGYASAWTRPGEGKPVVLLHGQLGSSLDWLPLLASKPDPFQGRPVTAIDLRGHGRSVKPGSGYDLESIAGDAAQAIDGLGSQPVTLVGDRLGALVAMLVAESRSDQVSDLVLIDPPIPGADDSADNLPFWEGEIEILPWLAELKEQPLPVIEQSLGGIQEHLAPEQVALAARSLSQTDSTLVDEWLENGIPSIETDQLPDESALPAYIIRAGDEERRGLSDAGFAALRDQYPNFSFDVVPGQGNDLLAASPRRVATLIGNYLE